MILLRLLNLVKPLIKYMFLAVILGVLGHLCAFLLPVIGLYLFQIEYTTQLLIILIFCGIARGFFRYGEQYLNHFIAFKILARLRSLVFEKMRTLGEMVNRGELVTLISSDIELLEVFFAHTLSPIMIALIMNGAITYILFSISWIFGSIALVSYLTLGLGIPLVFGKMGTASGQKYRDGVGELNANSLEGIQGIKEIRDFDLGDKFLDSLKTQGEDLLIHQANMKVLAGFNRALCDGVVLLSAVLVVLFGITQDLGLNATLFGFVILISSFGPILSLSQLTNNLYLTRASAKRVLSLLEMTPELAVIHSEKPADAGDIEFKDVVFSYENTPVLNSVSLHFKQGSITGIKGASGSGKSTILKLLMRLYTVDEGSATIAGRNINTIDSTDLKNMESVMFQSTSLFNDTIFNNVKMARREASEDDVIQAMEKAGLSEFVEVRHTLMVASMGANLSSGECQRIGLARVFLHGGNLILLDEPTANLDALNEAMILHALQEYKENRTLIIVSHRESTLRFADTIYDMKDLLM